MRNAIVALHGYAVGFAVIGSWITIFFWALALRLTRYEDTPTFWRAVSVAQVLLVVQLLFGLTLLTMWAFGLAGLPADRLLDNVFHPLYGFVFPFVVLFVAHKWSREGRFNPHSAFAVAAFVIFGLTTRAWMVGALGS